MLILATPEHCVDGLGCCRINDFTTLDIMPNHWWWFISYFLEYAYSSPTQFLCEYYSEHILSSLELIIISN